MLNCRNGLRHHKEKMKIAFDSLIKLVGIDHPFQAIKPDW
jgi:hypothetical protein